MRNLVQPSAHGRFTDCAIKRLTPPRSQSQRRRRLQLGFNHQDSGQSFVLDFADLHRDKLTIPAAFRAIKSGRADPSLGVERVARRTVGAAMRREA
jgi:hypothetical protein